jgi:hypothetical protein
VFFSLLAALQFQTYGVLSECARSPLKLERCVLNLAMRVKFVKEFHITVLDSRGGRVNYVFDIARGPRVAYNIFKAC